MPSARLSLAIGTTIGLIPANLAVSNKTNEVLLDDVTTGAGVAVVRNESEVSKLYFTSGNGSSSTSRGGSYLWFFVPGTLNRRTSSVVRPASHFTPSLRSRALSPAAKGSHSVGVRARSLIQYACRP